MSSVIIPRWEWRTFGHGFGAERERILKYGTPNVKESAEVYILSRQANENAKIRDGILDIKSLQAVNADKLEQWNPIMKEKFPLAASSITELHSVLRIPAPILQREEYAFEQFMSEIIAANPMLKAVDVKKRRFGLTINECTVEYAETWFNGFALETICVEHACSGLVMSTVKELGLQEHENINYIRAMKGVVNMTNGVKTKETR